MSDLSLTLTRRTRLPQGILGELVVQDGAQAHPVFHTLELPWRDNEKGNSCIPAGEYEIYTRRGGGYYETYRKRWDHSFAIGVRYPGDEAGHCGVRTHILIHTGNKPIHTRGCILVGETFGVAGDAPRVWRSRDAYERLYDAVKGGLHGMALCAPLRICEAATMALGEPQDESEDVDRGDL